MDVPASGRVCRVAPDRSGPKCKVLMLDNDKKYFKPFVDTLKNRKIKTQRTPIRSPNMVAFAERFVQMIKQECLDHFVVFGSKHMDVLCQEFKIYYQEERPHQRLKNALVISDSRTKKQSKSKAKPTETVSIPISEIHCQERFGGLLKSYSRKAA
jgi:putative transposase